MIRDRIRDLRRVKASELIPHPKNWRIHPEKQARLLQGTLQEIGYADALLAREDEEGRLHLIDGHLRAETTPDQSVPVLVLDLDEEEADKLLAVHDPLAAMAETDQTLLEALVSEMKTDDEAIRSFFDGVLQNGDEAAKIDPDSPERDVSIPELFQVVVECDDEEDQHSLFEELNGQGRKCRLLNL